MVNAPVIMINYLLNKLNKNQGEDKEMLLVLITLSIYITAQNEKSVGRLTHCLLYFNDHNSLL